MSSDGAAGGVHAPGPQRPTRSSALLDSRADEYAEILRECLPPDLQPLIPYFAYPDRLSVLATMLDNHFTDVPGKVLNVGCGPFATEFFVLPLRPHQIVSFDYTRGFVPAHEALARRGHLADIEFLIGQRGHLADIEFLIGDATTLEFEPTSFDLVVMHDILYEPALDFERMLVKYDRYLRPGGLLYLTVLDRGTQWIWKLLSREKPHVRYSLAAVRSRVELAGYRVLDCQPASLQSRNRAKRSFQRLLWHAFGLANHYAIIARKAHA